MGLKKTACIRMLCYLRRLAGTCFVDRIELRLKFLQLVANCCDVRIRNVGDRIYKKDNLAFDVEALLFSALSQSGT